MPFHCRKNGKFLTVPFDKLDFGETSVLETFSNADVAIVDMTSKGQAALSYHVGVRDSLGMKDNFMLFRDENPEETISMKVWGWVCLRLCWYCDPLVSLCVWLIFNMS